MPDVYHYDEETGEAITLFGSVPIDDTQASEETVYSSAKVEAMMDNLVVEQKNYSGTISAIPANSNAYYQIDITKAGYKPMAIVGVMCYSSNHGIAVESFTIVNDTQAIIYVINTSSSAQTPSIVYVKVLYRRV